MLNITRLALLASLISGPAVAAGFEVPSVDVRLIASGGLADGVYRTAITLDLPEGWHSYWKNPGDTGIPPVFDTKGSANLAAVEIGYPVPERKSDEIGTSLVYEGALAFPIRVRPVDAAAPVELTIRFRYGLCADVCLPADATVTAHLDPAAPADATAAVADAEAKVPTPAEDDRLAIDSVQYDAGRGEVVISLPDDGRLVDLFAAGPDRWYVGAPVPVDGQDGRKRFSIAIEGDGKDATKLDLSLVIVATDGAREVLRTLDLGGE